MGPRTHIKKYTNKLRSILIIPALGRGAETGGTLGSLVSQPNLLDKLQVSQTLRKKAERV